MKFCGRAEMAKREDEAPSAPRQMSPGNPTGGRAPIPSETIFSFRGFLGGLSGPAFA
jgi:hypothetical protein